MVPLKLTLKNFLCYGEGVPALDLEGIHVACLCGQNGHGKSALLDAITWALWGRARGKAQDELVHFGRDEMLVDLEFRARDTRYRAVRRHALGKSRRRSGSTDLQLQVRSASGFLAITGNSVRDTQAKIDEITGIDYDTFINSAFLLQGRADEFTNKTAGERKEVLAKILGLGYYDRLQDQAKGRAEERKVAAAILEGDLDRIRREVASADRYRDDLKGVVSELGQVELLREASKTGWEALRARVEELVHRRGELDQLKMRIPGMEADMSGLQEESRRRQSRIVDYRALMDDKGAIEDGYSLYQQLRNRYEELNSSRKRFDQLTGLRVDLEKEMEREKASLEERVNQMRARLELEIRPKAEAAPGIHTKLEDVRALMRKLVDDEQALEEERARVNGLAARVGQFEAAAQQLKGEGTDLRSKLELARKSQGGASCPLCGTELGADGCQRLADSYNIQIEEKLRAYRKAETDLKAAQQEQLVGEKDLPRRRERLQRGRNDAQSSVAVLDRELEESQAAARELEGALGRLEEASRLLEQGQYAPEQRARLAALGEEIGALGYDGGAHQQLYDEMEKTRTFEERHRLLREASESLPREQESQATSKEMQERREQELAEARAREKNIESEVSRLPESEARLREAEAAYREVEHRHGDLFRRRVELEGQLKRVEALEREMGGKATALKALREEQGLYHELVEAFGRRGVQAMLIETNLPSIEGEANALLERMTDGRMHLKLETQKDRRTGKGEPIETLEINISDELGPRRYEMFSGGEAFRINLALRIAISKVLARRRGSPLPTLFVDEGFGTQDSAGRERILDVIRAIEGDFEQIIVITHMDEIREAFPARIEVRKEEAGSTFWIS